MTFLKKFTMSMTDFQPPIARNTNKTQPKLKKKEEISESGLGLRFALL